jgi:hypothetical protein
MMGYYEEREEALENEFNNTSAFETEEQETKQFGYLHLDRQWLLTNYDTYVKNPHYVGEDQPHPEDD